MRSARASLAAALALLLIAVPASADDGWGFRLTTPRGEIVDDGEELLVAIPGGRAWGIASGLQRLPDAGTTISVDIELRDVSVREAFLRIAYYARVTGRPRQVDVADSPLVRSGERARVEVRIDPPDGAVAYRARVLGRLLSGAERSSAGGIAVRDLLVEGASPSPGPRRTRLIPDH